MDQDDHRRYEGVNLYDAIIQYSTGVYMDHMIFLIIKDNTSISGIESDMIIWGGLYEI